MRNKILLFIFIIVLLSLIVEAQNIKIGYVARSRADNNFLEVFEDKGHDVTVINDDNVRSTDFSEFDILFVGDNDNKLKNFQFIPVGDMPTIVANTFHADDWGLSFDISLVAANEPLKVLVLGDGIKQVYTTCCVGGSGAGLPLYYLTSAFKASDFENIAVTQIGQDQEGLSEGVIQYMDTGGRLLNNKNINGRMCFFGITATRYWTSNARELFGDCAQFVEDGIEEIICEDDSDCDDSDDSTIDSCVNPGTVDSFCRNEPFACLTDDDCGEDGVVGGLFCSEEDNVVQEFVDFTCLNPGTEEAECQVESSEIVIEECNGNLCVDGECVDVECNSNDDCDDGNELTLDICVNPGEIDSECLHEVIECASESDCGIDGFVGVEICSEDDVVRRFVDYTCNNPGEADSFCSSREDLQVQESCSDACVEGECIDFVCETNEECFDGNPNTEDICINPGTIDSFCHHGFIACNNDNDCGVNLFIGSLYCSENDIFQNFLDYECVNPGEADSYCTLTSAPTQRDSCENACINAGICIECDEDLDCDDGNSETLDRCEFPGHFFARCVNLVPICEVDSDCGEERDTGELFCINDDVYANHLSFSCLEPGTLTSSCSSEINQRLVQECDFGCSEGQCLSPVHDVALDNLLSNSVNGVRLEFTNGTDILEDPAVLMSGDDYKVVVKVLNLGDFYENITFSGEVRDASYTLVLSFTHNPKYNLAPGDDTTKTKTVNFLLDEGFYNLSVGALIPFDEVPENNNVVRTIHVITTSSTSTTSTTTSSSTSTSSSSTSSSSTTTSTSSSSSSTSSSSTSTTIPSTTTTTSTTTSTTTIPPTTTTTSSTTTSTTLTAASTTSTTSTSSSTTSSSSSTSSTSSSTTSTTSSSSSTTSSTSTTTTSTSTTTTTTSTSTTTTTTSTSTSTTTTTRPTTTSTSSSTTSSSTTSTTTSTTTTTTTLTTQCNDGIDNDGDGAIDYPIDFSCSNTQDNDETNPRSQCQDGNDNDFDLFVDMEDPQCTSPQDNTEDRFTPGRTQCSNGRDDDFDLFIDMEDPGCTSIQDNTEGPFTPGRTQCSDGLDNDFDLFIDMEDPQCTSQQDNTENRFTPGRTQCSDGRDNDFDLFVDIEDPDCTSQQDNTENRFTPGRTQCSNGIDDDGDGWIDMWDPGCTSLQDNTENTL